MQGAQELCESRGGRPGLPSLISTVSVDVKQRFNKVFISSWWTSWAPVPDKYGFYGRKATLQRQSEYYIYAETATESHVNGQTSQSRSMWNGSDLRLTAKYLN